MNPSQMAQALGRLGGLARSQRLSADQRRRIAAKGGRARRDSRLIAARIEENFRYAAATDALAGGRPPLERRGTARGPLPGPR